MGLLVDKGIEREERAERLKRVKEDAAALAEAIVPAVADGIVPLVAKAVAEKVSDATKPPPIWKDRGIIAALLGVGGTALVAWWFGGSN
jgi:hypothetical protein